MPEFRMPSLGSDMESGTVAEWRVKPGDRVERGQIVAVVDTDKGAIEVEIFDSGTVDQILVPEGTKVPVGTELARLSAEGAIAAEAAAPAAAEPVASAAAPGVPATVAATVDGHAGAMLPPSAAAVPTPTAPPAHLRVSPLARRIAADLGVDLAQVHGTGPGGAINREDVERAAAEQAGRAAMAVEAPVAPIRPPAQAAVSQAPPAAVTALPESVEGLTARPEAGARATARPEPVEGRRTTDMSPPPPTPVVAPPAPTPKEVVAARQAAMRRAIANVMARSKREVPHYYVGHDIDMRRALAWLEAENLKRPVTQRILPAALLYKATALAIHEVPEMNGFWVNDALQVSEAIHLGVAISLRGGGGLIAPAIHHTDLLSLDELMAAMRDLVMRARSGGLRSSEMSDPTLTVTNLGDQGVDEVYGVIYVPQVALVGFGTVRERPWAVDGLLGVRPIVKATLSADHRAGDGHRGALFLAAISRLLQEPEKL